MSQEPRRRFCALRTANAGRLALTLVELLVVISIIGVLTAMLLPAVGSVRESARQIRCASNLHQLGLGLGAFHQAKSSYPIGCTDRRPFGSEDERQLAWCVFLLPYIEQVATWEDFDIRSAYDSRRNRAAASQVISLLLCPSTSNHHATRRGARTDDGLGATDYGGMFGALGPGLIPGNGVMLFNQRIRMDQVSDGVSQTIIVAEDTGRGTVHDAQWSNGENIFDVTTTINTHQHNELWSDHDGGAQVLFCDGAVRFLSTDIELTVVRAMCTRAAKDEVPGELLAGP